MNDISSLSLKIAHGLKERIKAAAAENGVTISAEVSARLLRSFESEGSDAQQANAIDNQHTEERVEQPLSAKELKKLRQLIKGKSKESVKKK
ncbi:hypothetical protein ACLEEB_09610 [Lonsdalea quercina]|uniref:Arc-like DNA binding domain-containing protein n=1 Tax=Lonsdalea quercina TaxID=71657 RepID=A0A1H3YR97_9GAMM|nr:hypothetical protein [Lonsdalea quercina]SEA13731.1 hypothetical protein SAMN02982996_01074 [Lonsdalea quercina]